MNTLLHKLGTILIAPIMIVSGWFGGTHAPAPEPSVGGTFAIETPIALFQTTLASGITSSASAMTLVSATTLDGSVLASSTYSFIIDEGTASQEFVKADCTSTVCTNMSRGLSAISGTTTVSALQKAHRRGSSVKITDAPLLLNLTRILNGIGTLPNVLSYTSANSFSSTTNQLVSAAFAIGAANTASTSAALVAQTQNNAFAGTNTHAGGETFNSTVTLNGAVSVTATTTSTKSITVGYAPTASLDVATKGYVDGVAIAGASNASETAKGIAELATNAEAAAGTSSGGTAARLVLPASIATSTSQVAQNSVVVTKSTGKIDPSFLNGSAEEYTLTALNLTRSTSTAATTTNLYVSGAASTTDIRTNTLTVGTCTGCSPTITRVTGANSSCGTSLGNTCSVTAACVAPAKAVGAGGASSDALITLYEVSMDGSQTVTVKGRVSANTSAWTLTAYAMCI